MMGSDSLVFVPVSSGPVGRSTVGLGLMNCELTMRKMRSWKTTSMSGVMSIPASIWRFLLIFMGLAVREEAFAQVGDEFVEVGDEAVDASLEHFGGGH